MWTAVPAAVFVTALILTFATLTVSVVLTRRQKGKIFIEVRLFGLGFTIIREINQDSDIEEITDNVDRTDLDKSKQMRDNHRGQSQ